MGGDIRVESEEGLGSTFIFTIRTRPADTAPAGVPISQLVGRKVALVVRHQGLRSEIAHLLRLTGAKVLEYTLEALPASGWDLAVVDCDGLLLKTLDTVALNKRWRPECMFGLVAINLGNEQRQAVRRHFRMLLNRPVHHRALLELLVKTAEGLGSRRTTPPLFSAANGLRVLVAEDEPVLQRLITNTLTTLGCSCRFAQNGRECLEAVEAGGCDVILMDVHMPEMDGLTAIKQIRAGEAGATVRNIWIITITADHRNEMRDMALAAGVNDFLTKPISLTDLEGALRRFLEARKTRT
jgi:CheY-like chemotaxis protein